MTRSSIGAASAFFLLISVLFALQTQPAEARTPWQIDADCAAHPPAAGSNDEQICARNPEYWQRFCSSHRSGDAAARCQAHSGAPTSSEGATSNAGAAPTATPNTATAAPIGPNTDVTTAITTNPPHAAPTPSLDPADLERQRRLEAEQHAQDLQRQNQALQRQASDAERLARQRAGDAEAARLAAQQEEARRRQTEANAHQAISERDRTINQMSKFLRDNQVVLGGAAAVLAIAAVCGWWLFGRKSGQYTDVDRRLQQESRRARELRSRVPPDPVENWVLEGEGAARGLRLKLPGAKLPEGAGGVRIGRSPAHADSVLTKSEISRAHARFFARGSDLYVEDLGSKNGTSIRDEQLARGDRKLVYDGDFVDLGPYRFKMVRVD